jgi:hypothetical protein
MNFPFSFFLSFLFCLENFRVFGFPRIVSGMEKVWGLLGFTTRGMEGANFVGDRIVERDQLAEG